MELDLGLRLANAIGELTFASTETDAVFVLLAHLPGFEKDEIELSVNEAGTEISVSGGGEQRASQELAISRRLTFLRRVSIGRFQKVFRIPNSVVLDRIYAVFHEEQAILIVLMPRLIREEESGLEESKEEPPGRAPEENIYERDRIGDEDPKPHDLGTDAPEERFEGWIEELGVPDRPPTPLESDEPHYPEGEPTVESIETPSSNGELQGAKEEHDEENEHENLDEVPDRPPEAPVSTGLEGEHIDLSEPGDAQEPRPSDLETDAPEDKTKEGLDELGVPDRPPTPLESNEPIDPEGASTPETGATEECDEKHEHEDVDGGVPDQPPGCPESTRFDEQNLDQSATGDPHRDPDPEPQKDEDTAAEKSACDLESPEPFEPPASYRDRNLSEELDEHELDQTPETIEKPADDRDRHQSEEQVEEELDRAPEQEETLQLGGGEGEAAGEEKGLDLGFGGGAGEARPRRGKGPSRYPASFLAGSVLILSLVVLVMDMLRKKSRQKRR